MLEFRYGLPRRFYTILDASYAIGFSKYLLNELGILPTKQFIIDDTPEKFQEAILYYKNPSPAVSILIVKHDKVLLGRRAYGSFKAGMWCLPCGFIEYDDDFLTAARREVQEETGLIVDIQSIISVMSNYLTPNLHTLVVVLLAQVVGGGLCPGDDIDRVKWFPLAGPLPKMAFEGDENIIARYSQTGINGAPVDGMFAIIENKK